MSFMDFSDEDDSGGRAPASAAPQAGYPIDGHPGWRAGVPGADNVLGVVKAGAKNVAYAGPITCDSRLPDGETVGDVVRDTADDINTRAALGEDKIGMFVSAALPHGPLDFKNLYGPDNSGYLGATGNFAYGALASGVGVPQGLAEAGAGAYAATHLKATIGNPWLEDASAAKFLPQGYRTQGCR